MRLVVTLLLAGATLAACQAENAAAPNANAAASAAAAPAAPPPAGGPPMTGDPSKNPDMSLVAKTVDTNGDGRMSRAEWQAQGLPVSSFNMFEKGRGYVTLKDYQVNAAPPGIDLDGDGTLTVQEFREFDRRMSTRRPPAP